jgi:hypothetical protein
VELVFVKNPQKIFCGAEKRVQFHVERTRVDPFSFTG